MRQGYPQRLQGDESHGKRRIVFVADTFDANDYGTAVSTRDDLEAALTRLKEFCRNTLRRARRAAFIAACEAGKIRPA